MLGLLVRHGFIAICIAVIIEELGIPMPIPTDILIVTAGATGGSWERFFVWFVLLSLASATGASGLYAAIRRGGRPLVDRFGRYVHLGPKALERGEALLARSGWFGIALGRATPGLRLPTVIVCGLLAVPYRRFISAHIAGSAVYIIVFLSLGRAFGPRVLEFVHLPRVSFRLISLLLLAAGLPTLLAWLCSRAQIKREDDIPPGRHLTLSAAIFSALVGTVTFTASWGAGLALADLANEPPPMTASFQIARRMLGRSEWAYILSYVFLVSAGVILGALFLELILPLIVRRFRTLRIQSVSLTILAFAFCELLGLLAPTPPGPPRHFPVAVFLILGSAAYAVTTVCARALALILLPSGRERPQSNEVAEGPETVPPASSAKPRSDLSPASAEGSPPPTRTDAAAAPCPTQQPGL